VTRDRDDVRTLVSPEGRNDLVEAARAAALSPEPQPYAMPLDHGPPLTPSGYPMPIEYPPTYAPSNTNWRTFLALFFGAIALMAVGFATVALVLHLLG
jgi:hypothetical protein